jgi:nitrate reductase gamma subunit
MLLIILISVAVVVFVAGNAVRIVKFLRMPTPLRWELYPIPKGPRERQRYGGSYFEQSDWWTNPPETGHKGELAFMAKEVLLLRSVWENFRGLWLWSWLLHWGLYLYLLVSALAFGEAVLPVGGGFRSHHLAVRYGYLLACWLGLLGSIGLLVMRSVHPRLRGYSTRSSIFNAFLLGCVFATGLLSFGDENGLDGIIRDLLHSPASLGDYGKVAQTHLALVVFFLAYFPFTHMTHAYMKYFTWHGVRWNDSPAIHDPGAAKTLATNLRREVTWAAPHITAGDPAKWSEVAADTGGRGAGQRA